MIGKIFDKGKGSFRNRIEYIFGLSKHEHAITTIRTIGKNWAVAGTECNTVIELKWAHRAA